LNYKFCGTAKKMPNGGALIDYSDPRCYDFLGYIPYKKGGESRPWRSKD
jgi:hypothetical protein